MRRSESALWDLGVGRGVFGPLHSVASGSKSGNRAPVGFGFVTTVTEGLMKKGRSESLTLTAQWESVTQRPGFRSPESAGFG